MLDEATSNIDVKTEEMIQKSLTELFKDCTVITIAHRLNTIANSDKILVMSEGRVAEYDKPSVLLAD